MLAKFPLQKSSFSPATAPEKQLDAGRITTQLRTQEEGMMSIVASLSLNKKPRFIELVGKSQTSEGDAC
jgi:hypothetical protein